MKWLTAIAHEILGLFVDDWGFALALVAWLLLAWWASPHLALAHRYGGVMLFAGLGLILFESATRFARHQKHTRRSAENR